MSLTAPTPFRAEPPVFSVPKSRLISLSTRYTTVPGGHEGAPAGDGICSVHRPRVPGRGAGAAGGFITVSVVQRRGVPDARGVPPALRRVPAARPRRPPRGVQPSPRPTASPP